MVNIGLILGIALMFSAILVDGGSVVREYPAAAAAPLVLGLLALDGTVGPIDGLVLLVIFRGLVGPECDRRPADPGCYAASLLEHSRTSVVVNLVVGLALLVVAGRLILAGAIGVSEALGWDAFVVGAVLVALGTSAPELATVLIARLRGHDEVVVGTLLGSNIFNTLLIVGIAALIHPISIARSEVEVGIVVSMLVVVLAIPGRSARLGRWRGAPLVATYLAMVAFLSSGSGA